MQHHTGYFLGGIHLGWWLLILVVILAALIWIIRTEKTA